MLLGPWGSARPAQHHLRALSAHASGEDAATAVTTASTTSGSTTSAASVPAPQAKGGYRLPPPGPYVPTTQISIRCRRCWQAGPPDWVAHCQLAPSSPARPNTHAEIVSIIDAPPQPSLSYSPDRTRFLQIARPQPLPPIYEMSRPELKLAGLRIDPEIYARWATHALCCKAA